MKQTTGTVVHALKHSLRRGRRGAVDDLFWRWHLAEGEIRQVCSPAYEKHGRGGYKLIALAVKEWEDSDTLSGKVFVPPPKRKEPSYEMSEAAVAAVSRSRRIDAALAILPSATARTLWLAIGAPVNPWAYPIPATLAARPDNPAEPGPALCNLLEATRTAAELSRKAGKSPRAWLDVVARALVQGVRGDLEVAARRACAEARDELDTALRAFEAASRLVASRKGRERWN